MKRKSGILIFLAFVLILTQLPGIQSTYAASSGNQNVQVMKVVSPSEILEGGEAEVTINVQGSPDSQFVKPNDIILIIDRSGSMAASYGPNNGEDKMLNAKEAAKGFIDLVDFTKHKVGVVDFASDVNSKNLSTNPTELKQYINGIQANGGTETHKAIEVARNLLKDHREEAQPVIILLTDGQANDSAKALEQAGIAKSEGIVFYTIALLLKNEDPITSAPNLLMKDMATTAHHHHYVLGSVGLAEIYARIVEEIGIASAYDVKVTDSVSPEFEIVAGSYKDNIPQPVIVNNTITWNFLELKNELLTFKYKIRHKLGATVGTLPTGNQEIKVQYKDYLGAPHEYTVIQPEIKVNHYAPIITSVVKDNGLVQGGEQVVINGEYFRPNLKVYFGNTETTSVQYVSDSQLIVTAPAGVQGTVPVKVINDDGQFATAEYRYYAVPEIISVLPVEGPLEGGTKVVINGNYFMTGVQVKFGENLATVSKTEEKALEVITPAGTTPGYVSITVINPDGTTASIPEAFNYIQGPEITLISPNVGERTGGQQVAITGQRFVDGAQVFFNSKLVTSSFTSSNELIVTTPSWTTAETVAVKVINPNGQQSVVANGYTYEDPTPVITSFTPGSGPMAGGTVVTVKGNYFKSGAKLYWNDLEQTDYTFVSTTDVRFKTPSWTKAETVSFKIVNPDGKQTELKDAFQYLAPPEPTLSSITPISGLISGGTSVTLTGTNLTSDLKVFFDNVEVPIVSSTATKLTVKTPIWTTPEKVDVSIETTVGLRLSLPDAFEYLPLPTPPAPVISAVSPSSGSVVGGNIISINGSNFVNGLKLYFNDTLLENYTYMSSSQVRLKAPAWAKAELVTIKIINPDDQSAQLVEGYTYIPLPAPTLTSVTPSKGPMEGGTLVKLLGSNFQSGAKVKLGDQEIASTYISSSEIRVTSPVWNVAETVDVSVENPDGQIASVNGAFTFEAPPVPVTPTITELTPNTGPQEGGTTVSIKGSEFTANPEVKFDQIIVSASYISPTEIRVITPAWSTASTVAVTVTTKEGLSATLDNAFTYLAPPEKPSPEITSLTPNSIELSASSVIVTLKGANFQQGAIVFFGDTALATSYMNTTQLRFKSPVWSQAESIDVKVQNPDGKEAILAGGFTYLTPPPPPAPVITSVTPDQGFASTSTLITVRGENFVNGAKIVMNNVELNASYLSSTQLRVYTPIWAGPESVTIKVINPDGQEAVLPNGYTFVADLPPQLTSISPNSGLNSGGGVVILTGSNLKSGAVVFFNNIEVPTTYYSSTQLRVKVPAWSTAEIVDVTVVNPDGQQAIIPAGYTYTLPPAKPAPVINEITPSTGLLKGGYIVNITGSNFQSGAKIILNNDVVINATYMNSSTLRIKMPAGKAVGPVTVTVVNPDEQSVTLVDGFTYN